LKATHSMTGYGQASVEFNGIRIHVAARSVNNRFADVRLRLPNDLTGTESGIRRRVLARIRRGRVELNVGLERLDGADRRPVLNRELMQEVRAALGEMEQSVSDPALLLGIQGMFRPESIQLELDDEVRAALERAVDDALDALEADRAREGQSLSLDLQARLATMERIAATVRERAADQPDRLRDRLVERLQALTGDVELDPVRVAQEAAFLADRADVTEEIVRLAGHLEQAKSLLASPDGEPVGKRLDFLVQELHREVNTIGSKSSDLELTRMTLELKAETERVREQVQNLE